MRSDPTVPLPANERKARQSFGIWWGAICSALLGVGCIWALLRFLGASGPILGKIAAIGLCAWLAAFAMRWFFNYGSALIRNDSSGVRVDTEKNQLIWWTRSGPEFQKSIPLNGISVIRHDTEDDSIVLLNGQGKPIEFDTNCIGHAEFWSDSMIRSYPHMRLERH